jgi:hypothetical protein
MNMSFITNWLSAGGNVAKSFSLGSDGSVKVTPGATELFAGRAVTLPVETSEDMAALLNRLTPRETISTGIIKGRAPFEKVRFATTAARRSDEIARSLDFMGWHDGAGWLLLDHDTGKAPQWWLDAVQAAGGVRALLGLVIPGFEKLGRVVRPSSSAGLMTAAGRVLIDSAACHVWIRISNVARSKDVLRHIALRLWALSFGGWIDIRKSGGLFEKGVVDLTVGSPERLVFCAPPVLSAGLARADAVVRWKDGETLDVAAFLATPVDGGPEKLAAAMQAAAIEGENIKGEWLAGQHARMTARGMSDDEAREAVAALLSGELDMDFELVTSNGQRVTVRQLVDGDRDRVSIADPFEGEEYGTNKATFLGSQEGRRVPCIVSHAHGMRRTFHFRWPACV